MVLWRKVLPLLTVLQSAALHLNKNMALSAPEMDFFYPSSVFSDHVEKALLRLQDRLDALSLLTYQRWVLLGLASSMDSAPLEQWMERVFSSPLHRCLATWGWVCNFSGAAHMPYSSSELCDERHRSSRYSVMCSPKQHKTSNNLSKAFRRVLRAHWGQWDVHALYEPGWFETCYVVHVSGHREMAILDGWTAISPLRNS